MASKKPLNEFYATTTRRHQFQCGLKIGNGKEKIAAEQKMCDDYETHVDRPLDPEVRRLILQRRASREADLPEEIDGNRFSRKKSTDYKEFSNAQTLADLQERFEKTVTKPQAYTYHE